MTLPNTHPGMTMLLEPLSGASLQLANRVVMAPMTRSRAVEANTPNATVHPQP